MTQRYLWTQPTVPDFISLSLSFLPLLSRFFPPLIRPLKFPFTGRDPIHLVFNPITLLVTNSFIMRESSSKTTGSWTLTGPRIASRPTRGGSTGPHATLPKQLLFASFCLEVCNLSFPHLLLQCQVLLVTSVIKRHEARNALGLEPDEGNFWMPDEESASENWLHIDLGSRQEVAWVSLWGARFAYL